MNKQGFYRLALCLAWAVFCACAGLCVGAALGPAPGFAALAALALLTCALVVRISGGEG